MEDNGIPYPPHEQAADRKAGKRTARTWTPRDPRDPEPPPSIMLICAEAFATVLGEYQTHQAGVKAIETQLADARVHRDTAQEARNATDAPLAITTDGAARPTVVNGETSNGGGETPDGDAGASSTNKYREFEQAQDERLRRNAENAHAEAVADRHRRLDNARREVTRLEAERQGADDAFRLTFAAHATKGARRIRTVIEVVRARHRLRDQLAALDQRCLDELKNTFQQLGDMAPPGLSDGGRLPVDVEDEE